MELQEDLSSTNIPFDNINIQNYAIKSTDLLCKLPEEENCGGDTNGHDDHNIPNRMLGHASSVSKKRNVYGSAESAVSVINLSSTPSACEVHINDLFDIPAPLTLPKKEPYQQQQNQRFVGSTPFTDDFSIGVGRGLTQSSGMKYSAEGAGRCDYTCGQNPQHSLCFATTPNLPCTCEPNSINLRTNFTGENISIRQINILTIFVYTHHSLYLCIATHYIYVYSLCLCIAIHYFYV